MNDRHVHCAECGLDIATQVKIAGGKTKPAPIARGTRFAVVPGPNGLNVIPEDVPLCDDCNALLIAQQKAAASGLVVAQAVPADLREKL